MTATTYTPAAFEGIHDKRDHEITTLMRARELESVLANSRWVPQAVSEAAKAKIEVLTAMIEAKKAAKRS